MKKILIVVLIIIVLAVGVFALYSYLDGFPISMAHGKLIIYHYTCGDICPAYGYWQKQYYNVKSEDECRRIGGEPAFVTYAGVVEHGYNGCLPTSISTPTTPQVIDSFKKYSNSLLGIEFNYPKNFIPYLRDNEYIGDQPSRFTSGKDSHAPLYENSYFVINLAGARGYYDCPSLTDPKMSYSGSYEVIQRFIQEGEPIKFEDCKEIIQSIDQAVENSAYHKLRPFGENPIINKLQIKGEEARLIIPSDLSNNERELIVKLKNPILLLDKYWTFLVIHTSRDLDGETMKVISESLRFL